MLVVLSVTTLSSLAQNSKVRGIVTDDLNQFVVNAQVTLAGTTFTSKTDASGAFELSDVPEGNYNIEIIADEHLPFSQPVSVKGSIIDLGILTTSASAGLDAAMMDNVPTVSISDAEIRESAAQSVSGVLSASRDAFNAAASFTFSAARFKVRGYDNDNFVTYMNGVPMTDLYNGNSMFYLWGGLNDVTRNRENVSNLFPGTFSFGGIGGSNYIDTRAYGTGVLKGGWAFAGSISRRWSDEGYIPGTYYDGWSYFAAAEKIINYSHSVSLTMFGTPTERGRSSPATKEMYDLAGSNYYNPTWGYQNGEKRNASVNISHQPTAILSHDWKINNQSLLRTSVGYSFGENVNTGLDWYNAPDPRPDFYRKLPSYYSEFPEIAAQIEALLRASEEIRQIQWDDLYQANYNSFETIKDVDGIPGKTVSGIEIRLSASMRSPLSKTKS